MFKNILFTVVGLLIGLIVGFFAANSLNRQALVQNQTTASATDKTATSLDHGMPDKSAIQNGAMPEIAAKMEKAKNEPNNFEAQMEVGDLYSQIGRYDEAVKYYQAGIKLQPNNFQANVVLANVYFDTKQYEEAEKYYAKALEINPKDVNSRTDLATTLVERPNPQFDRAIAEFKKSLELEPKHEPTIYNLGVAYFKKGDKENAKKMLAQLEQANPNSTLIERMKKAVQ
ncbi:MAG TPA: tetratricopeptide repeat protein [Pyrinomonadaceae bacterium]|nr:tetratricopeptide repeat protein [Pyrinomonadaceae bacterium]